LCRGSLSGNDLPSTASRGLARHPGCNQQHGLRQIHNGSPILSCAAASSAGLPAACDFSIGGVRIDPEWNTFKSKSRHPQGEKKMTPGTPTTLQSVVAALLLGAGLLAGAAPAHGEELSWRQSSVRTEMQGLNYVRRGVAMFANGEPATLTFRGVAKPPEGTRQDFSGRMLMRFDDGATFTFDMQGATQYGPPGTPPTMSASGALVEGTGRFAGISGTIEFKGRGMDVMAEGNLGDIFGSGRATYTLKR